MSTLNENVFIFDNGEDKQLKLYREAFQECCNLSKKVCKDELFKLWDEVIDLAEVIKNKRKFLPTNKDLDLKIEEEKRKMQAAESNLNMAKQLYSSANFEFRKVREKLNDKNEKAFLNSIFKDYENSLKEQEELLLDKKQKLLSLTL